VYTLVYYETQRSVCTHHQPLSSITKQKQKTKLINNLEQNKNLVSKLSALINFFIGFSIKEFKTVIEEEMRGFSESFIRTVLQGQR
jgi:ABC-type sugar transport system ATPase subunit